jgi:APA family basic amino acid/polyamine antiporter
MNVNLPTASLRRILGIAFGVAIAIGGMIGSGILRAPSLIATAAPSAALILALWVVGALHSALGVNVLSELATTYPKAGGVYVYARRAFGDVAGLVIGWTDCVAMFAGTAAGSIAFADFLTLLVPQTASFKPIVAIVLQVLLYAANITGLKTGRAVQETTSVIKVIMVIAFVAAAASVVAGALPTRLAAAAAGGTVTIGWTGVILSYGMVLGAYAGWSYPAYFGEETEQPSRNIPRAMVLGLLLTATLYVLINAALLRVLGVHALARSVLPFTEVFARAGAPVPGVLFALGAMITVMSSTNGQMMPCARVILALARDGLLPAPARHINRGGSPDLAYLVSALATIALAATGSFAIVFGLIAVANAFGGVIINLALMRLRCREPTLERPFRAWGYPWLPLFLLAIDATLLLFLAWGNSSGVLFVIGLVVVCVPYALVARRGHRANVWEG